MIKSTGNKETDKEIFFRSVGQLFELILIELGKKYNGETQTWKDNNPFSLSAGWRWSTIEEEIIFAPNLNIHSQLKPDNVINYVDIDAIDNKRYVISDVKVKTVAELSSRARRVLSKGSVLYSLVRPYLILLYQLKMRLYL